jgi:integrase/recombinase XerD
LIRAKAEHIDHKHRQLTLIGKRNKQRTISLKPMAGYEFFKAIPAYLGSPFLFWHDEGEKYSTFPQQFWRKINREIVPYAKANGVDFRPFRFHDLRHLHAIEFLKSRSGTSMNSNTGLGIRAFYLLRGSGDTSLSTACCYGRMP